MRVPRWIWLARVAPFYTHLQACYPMLVTLSGVILSLCLPHPECGIIALIPFYRINDLGNITVEAMRDGTIPYWLQLP